MILFFNDWESLIDYFSAKGLLVSPEAVDKIFRLQSTGDYLHSSCVEEVMSTGYLTINDICTTRRNPASFWRP